MENQPVRQEPLLREARERTIEVLCAQFARDSLETAEFERRIDLAYRAETAVQLSALTTDLPAIASAEQAPARAAAPAGRGHVARRRPAALLLAAGPILHAVAGELAGGRRDGLGLLEVAAAQIVGVADATLILIGHVGSPCAPERRPQRGGS